MLQVAVLEGSAKQSFLTTSGDLRYCSLLSGASYQSQDVVMLLKLECYAQGSSGGPDRAVIEISPPKSLCRYRFRASAMSRRHCYAYSGSQCPARGVGAFTDRLLTRCSTEAVRKMQSFCLTLAAISWKVSSSGKNEGKVDSPIGCLIVCSYITTFLLVGKKERKSSLTNLLSLICEPVKSKETYQCYEWPAPGSIIVSMRLQAGDKIFNCASPV